MGSAPSVPDKRRRYAWSESAKHSRPSATQLAQRSSSRLSSPTWRQAEALPQKRKHVILEAPHGTDLGFSIRGGMERGIGIYVSFVEEESQAGKSGLEPGDQILRLNGLSFLRIPHADAARLIKSQDKLAMEIRHVGRVPGAYETHQAYTWVGEDGGRVSPPPEVDTADRYSASSSRRSQFMMLKASDERKVNLAIEEGSNLGLMIRGGSDYGLGIYISGVDLGSVADEVELKAGDQILDVNGCSFLDVRHHDAIRVLKTSRRLMLTVKDVGKIPHARTTYDHTEWVSSDALLQTRRSSSSSGCSSERKATVQHGQKFVKGIGSQLMHSSVAKHHTQWSLKHKPKVSKQSIFRSERKSSKPKTYATGTTHVADSTPAPDSTPVLESKRLTGNTFVPGSTHAEMGKKVVAADIHQVPFCDNRIQPCEEIRSPSDDSGIDVRGVIASAKRGSRGQEPTAVTNALQEFSRTGRCSNTSEYAYQYNRRRTTAQHHSNDAPRMPDKTRSLMVANHIKAQSHEQKSDDYRISAGKSCTSGIPEQTHFQTKKNSRMNSCYQWNGTDNFKSERRQSPTHYYDSDIGANSDSDLEVYETDTLHRAVNTDTLRRTSNTGNPHRTDNTGTLHRTDSTGTVHRNYHTGTKAINKLWNNKRDAKHKLTKSAVHFKSNPGDTQSYPCSPDTSHKTLQTQPSLTQPVYENGSGDRHWFLTPQEQRSAVGYGPGQVATYSRKADISANSGDSDSTNHSNREWSMRTQGPMNVHDSPVHRHNWTSKVKVCRSNAFVKSRNDFMHYERVAGSPNSRHQTPLPQNHRLTSGHLSNDTYEELGQFSSEALHAVDLRQYKHDLDPPGDITNVCQRQYDVTSTSNAATTQHEDDYLSPTRIAPPHSFCGNAFQNQQNYISTGSPRVTSETYYNSGAMIPMPKHQIWVSDAGTVKLDRTDAGDHIQDYGRDHTHDHTHDHAREHSHGQTHDPSHDHMRNHARDHTYGHDGDHSHDHPRDRTHDNTRNHARDHTHDHPRDRTHDHKPTRHAAPRSNIDAVELDKDLKLWTRKAIVVNKTRPLLGLSIEGGVDTDQPLPEIASIQAGGCAADSDLQPHHVILAVDGRYLDGLTHQQCATAIAQSFRDPAAPSMHFLVLQQQDMFELQL